MKIDEPDTPWASPPKELFEDPAEQENDVAMDDVAERLKHIEGAGGHDDGEPRAGDGRPSSAGADAPPPDASISAKKDDEWETQKANPAFNMALAAMVAGSVFVSDVVAPEYAEAARSGGRMGGSSFRSAPRMAPRGGMGGQSRQAPPPGAMRGGMGMGMPMIMPMPMFSPFGFGFGFGGLSFIFNILIFLWVANFFMSFVSSLTSGNDQQRRDDDDRF